MKTVLVGLMSFLVITNIQAASRLVKVSGTCEIKDVYDRYRVSIVIETTDKNQTIASSKVQTRNDEALAKVKGMNLLDLELRTLEYGLTPVREWEKNQMVFKGYKARSHISIEFSDSKRIGELLGVLAGLKLDEINGPSSFFSQTKEKMLNDKCLVEALTNAKAKADLMAKTLNTKIKRVNTIEENQTTARPPQLTKMMMATAEMASPQIELGTTEFKKEVYVEFELR